ncbi:PhzF family phenazine biosynthesis protein [Rhizobium ruizarguesonis]
MARSYSVYDVFTDRKLAGNPLAVIFDGGNLSDEAMQAITREINLSETVFVQPSANPAYAARLRIFTPGRELPFAGHPTVGTAVALAERAHGAATRDLVTVLEENVGPVRCAVRLRERVRRALPNSTCRANRSRPSCRSRSSASPMRCR